MKLYPVILKLLIKRFKINYLLIIVSMLAAYFSIAILMLFMEGIILPGTGFPDRQLQDIYCRVSIVIAFGGMYFMLIQYHYIMASSCRYFYILKALSRKKKYILTLVTAQIVSFTFIAVPLGLSSGYLLIRIVCRLMDGEIWKKDMLQRFDTMYIWFLVVGAGCCLIIFISILYRKRKRQTLVTQNHAGDPASRDKCNGYVTNYSKL